MHCYTVDYVPHRLLDPSGRATLQTLEDRWAVFKHTIRRRIPALRHDLLTHRVDLDWLFELMDGVPSIRRRHVKLLGQITGFLNKGPFTAQQFVHLCNLAHIGTLCPSSHNIVMANRSAKAFVIHAPQGTPQNNNTDNSSSRVGTAHAYKT